MNDLLHFNFLPLHELIENIEIFLVLLLLLADFAKNIANRGDQIPERDGRDQHETALEREFNVRLGRLMIHVHHRLERPIQRQ